MVWPTWIQHALGANVQSSLSGIWVVLHLLYFPTPFWERLIPAEGVGYFWKGFTPPTTSQGAREREKFRTALGPQALSFGFPGWFPVAQ